MIKVKFITQGCSANLADTEIMAGLLKEEGHLLTDDEKTADIIIFNTCTVKLPTENHFRKQLRELKNKKVLIAGCIPQAQKDDEIVKKYSCVGTFQLKRIAEAVERTMNGEIVTFLDTDNSSRLNISKERTNKIIEITPISQGCLGNCAYCKTKQARGNLVSIPIKDIVKHINKAVNEGVKEIWLTSQDNGAYGKDIGTDIIKLLDEILKIKGNYKIRFGMANPNYAVEFLDGFTRIFKDDRMYKFIHIPLQSGSDKVLKEMNRKYDSDDFKYAVEKLKENIPDILIMTDIIVGYPTETKDDFAETIALIRETQPDLINISKFWPRKGTKASLLKTINSEEVKRRTEELTKLFRNTAKQNNKRFIGKEYKVLIVKNGKNNTSVGMNASYRQVVVNKKLKIGTEVSTRITDAKEFYLTGELN